MGGCYLKEELGFASMVAPYIFLLLVSSFGRI